MASRIEALLQSVESNHHILELSPCHNPICSKNDNLNVKTVDCLTEESLSFDRQVAICKMSEFFDEQWYKEEYIDVANSGMDPVIHYVKFGAYEGRDPGPDFSTNAYVQHLKSHSSLPTEDINPLVHFMVYSNETKPILPASKILFNKYQEWIQAYDTLTDEDISTIKNTISGFAHKPLISIVMPVFNTPENWLEIAIESVLNQFYDNWELCIADDASSKPEIKQTLTRYAAKDKRIKVIFRKEQGHISAASNSALTLATGAFVALMDHDDIIPEYALYHVVKAINDNPQLSLIYSDEDHLNNEEKRFYPYFKSDWNPSLLYGHNCIMHFGIYRRSILEEIGGFRLGYEGSQDYDLALRVIERIPANQIHHIPKILYHWRQSNCSASRNDYAIAAARKAIESHLQRMGIKGRATANPFFESFHRVHYDLPIKLPLVSIIISANAEKSVLERCITSVIYKTNYCNYELVLVDCDNLEIETAGYIDRVTTKYNNIRIISNYDAEHYSQSDYLLLLSNKTEVLAPDWLSEMVSQGIQKNVGIVGAKLINSNDTIDEAGIICGLGSFAKSIYSGLPRAEEGIFKKLLLTQNFLAVSSACMLIDKALYEQLQGFKDHLSGLNKDLDLCLRAHEHGYQIIWTPFAELYHHNSNTKDNSNSDVDERNYMLENYRHYLESDPFYNPNLSLLAYDCSFAYPPRISKF